MSGRAIFYGIGAIVFAVTAISLFARGLFSEGACLLIIATGCADRMDRASRELTL